MGKKLIIGVVVILIILTLALAGLFVFLSSQVYTKRADTNVEQINLKVADEIEKLFVEDTQIITYLSNNIAEIKPGEDYGVAFAIRNQKNESDKFSYIITPEENNCDFEDAMSWIQLGKEGSINLTPGQDKVWLVRFEIPETAPLCLLRYKINVTSNQTLYASKYFDVKTIK
jgi:hypothetical protein